MSAGVEISHMVDKQTHGHGGEGSFRERVSPNVLRKMHPEKRSKVDQKLPTAKSKGSIQGLLLALIV